MLGTLIEKALANIGVDSAGVEKLIGGPCNCKERRDKLDELTFWARAVIYGRIRNGELFLQRILGDYENEGKNRNPTGV